MSEATVDQNLADAPVAVTVQEGQLGRQLSKAGQSFDLTNLVGEGANALGGDRFSEVYFRTESGNIYHLDRHQMINGNESKRTGHIVEVPVPEEELKRAKFTVGEPFVFNGGNTTRITEIVAVGSRAYVPDYLNKMTQGRKNTIAKEFLQGLPAPQAKAPGGFMRPK